MEMKTVDSVTIVSSKILTFSSETSEEHTHSKPSQQQLQLTTHNLRDLRAALKTLNVPGQTPRASPSPSDSSSDSESNHRLHRSTKKVCMREDMNTTREISPRPSRPVAILAPGLLERPQTDWLKPDMPVPWNTTALRDTLEEADSGSMLQRPTSRINAVSVKIQLNGLSLSPLGHPTSVDWNHSATNGDVASKIGAATRCFSRSSRGNGIGIYRRTHFALPRPQSLAKPRRQSFTGNSRDFNALSVSGASGENMKAGDLVHRCFEFQSMTTSSSPSRLALASSHRANGTAEKVFTTLPPGTIVCPNTSSQPSLIAQIASSRLPRQPSTYIDHVPTVRLPPRVMQSRTLMDEKQGELETPHQRRMSV